MQWHSHAVAPAILPVVAAKLPQRMSNWKAIGHKNTKAQKSSASLCFRVFVADL
jgi:hypothetical protein